MKRKHITGCTAKDDFKSDEEDCTIFHRCAYGYQYTYVCPPNNGFDSAQKVCNFMMYVPECQMLETACELLFMTIFIQSFTMIFTLRYPGRIKNHFIYKSS